MKRETLQQLVTPITTLATAAGDRILEFYQEGFSVAHKDDHTPLTDADLAAHNTLIAGLQQLTPELPILSEESESIPFAERNRWSRYWLIDPLDGTREFIKGNGEFTVNIALIEENRPILGVIQVPVNHILYFAWQGGGAWKQLPDEPPQRIEARTPPPEQLVVAGSRSHQSEKVLHFLDQIGSHRIFPMGSSLKSCLVAEGRADLYPRLGPTSEWDTAAAQCIVEEAGGRLVDSTMQPLRYNTRNSLLNPHFIVCGKGDRDWSDHLRRAETET